MARRRLSGLFRSPIPETGAPGDGPVGSPVPATTWELLAACLRAGLTVSAAVHAVLPGLSGGTAHRLRNVAQALAVGVEPEIAWSCARDCAELEPVAATAVRSSRSGAALASALDELADETRSRLRQEADRRAARVTVLLTFPVGLCFLPAFFCLGVLPTLGGMLGRFFELAG
ncbi:hypothetical protein D5S17_13270 [Pseudonocardiaceae bacterium YIM PH 21723]|nr:hypothetical protein D5S17_13270 [Pseudonocardiaceae bacterium YIM PH 21723]